MNVTHNKKYYLEIELVYADEADDPNHSVDAFRLVNSKGNLFLNRKETLADVKSSEEIVDELRKEVLNGHKYFVEPVYLDLLLSRGTEAHGITMANEKTNQCTAPVIVFTPNKQEV